MNVLREDPAHLRGFPHVLQSQQFSTQGLGYLFRLVESLTKGPRIHQGLLDGRKVVIIFPEPSVRTCLSFQFALEQLGVTNPLVIEEMRRASSMRHGDSLPDLVDMFLDQGFNCFVIRTDVEGMVARLAASIGPQAWVINAGDGPGQHPTQALIDLYAIWREFGDLSELLTDQGPDDHWPVRGRPLTVGLIGDLADSRATHSVVYLLAKFPDVEFRFISPVGTPMQRGITDHLDENDRRWQEVTGLRDGDLEQHVSDLDVLYVVGPRDPRPGLQATDAHSALREHQPYVISPAVAEAMPGHSIILHPLPRDFELPETVDDNPRARWQQQTADGPLVRAALFLWLARLQGR